MGCEQSPTNTCLPSLPLLPHPFPSWLLLHKSSAHGARFCFPLFESEGIIPADKLDLDSFTNPSCGQDYEGEISIELCPVKEKNVQYRLTLAHFPHITVQGRIAFVRDWRWV